MMLPAPASAICADRLTGETPREVFDALVSLLARTGRGNPSSRRAAALFLHRWPDVTAWAREPITVQLEATAATRQFINFLLVTGRVHPSWDYLVHRKFSSLWRDLPGTVIGEDIEVFIAAARRCGFTERLSSAMASQVMARVLFATGKPLRGITHEDFDALTAAGVAREARTGRTWRHYQGCATATKGAYICLPDGSLELD